MRARGTTIPATAAALVGFAANTLLCRAALGERAIDAWSFTAARLCAGAVVLWLLVRASSPRASGTGGSWASAFALFAYAATFSLAYLRLGAGIGALVLFGAVQATMIGWSIREGTRPTRSEWVGLAIALAGLAWLKWPGASAPDAFGLLLMVLAGVAWGAYSLRGRGSRSPLAATADNFARSVPFALVGLTLQWSHTQVSARGVWLAIVSGALASGLAYSLWYLALPALGAMRAALLQLLVPVLAAIGGIVLLGERLDARLAVAGPLILGGVAIAVLLRSKRSSAR